MEPSVSEEENPPELIIKNVFDEADESESEDVTGVGLSDLSDPETFGHSVDQATLKRP